MEATAVLSVLRCLMMRPAEPKEWKLKKFLSGHPVTMPKKYKKILCNYIIFI